MASGTEPRPGAEDVGTERSGAQTAHPVRLTLSLAAASYLGFWAISGIAPMRSLEDLLYASRMAWTPRPPIHPSLLLATKDDETWSRPPGGRWGRHVLAETVRLATGAGIAAVGIDFVMDQPRDEDGSLVAVLAQGPPCVGGSQEIDPRSLATNAGDVHLEAISRSGREVRSTAGPHSGLLPWIGEGFLNLGRSRLLKAPAVSVELYRPGNPPVAGFAFALYLAGLADEAWKRLPAPAALPGPDAGDEVLAGWLAGLAGAALPAGPVFPDPAMERLLRREEIRTALRRVGLARDPERISRLETRVPSRILPIRLPAPPPARRVHRIDYAGPARTVPWVSMARLGDPRQFDLLRGAVEVQLAAGDRVGPQFSNPHPGPSSRLVPRSGRLVGEDPEASPDWRGALVMAVGRDHGRISEARADGAGRFRLELPEGERFDLFAIVPLAGGGDLFLSLLKEGMVPGDPELEVRIPRCRAAVELVGPPGSRFELSSAGLEAGSTDRILVSGNALAGSDGRVILRGLPAGDYAALRVDPGADPGPPGFVSVAVPAATPTRFEPPGRPLPALCGLRAPPVGAEPGAAWEALRLTDGERFSIPQEGRFDLRPGRYLLVAEMGEVGRFAWSAGRRLLEGKWMLMGTVMEADQDAFPTPVDFGRERDMPGVEVHAHALSNLLSGRQLAPAGLGLDLGLGIATLVGAGLAFHHLSPVVATLVGIGFLGFHWLVAAWMLAGPGLVLTGGPTLASGVVFLTLELALFLRGTRRQMEHIREMFGKCVDPVLRDRLLEAPDLVLKGESREVTVLFSDVRGFTTLSEQLEPHALVETLNSYFSRVTPVFLQHGGVFDKFIGDAFMGFFGAPLDQPDHREQAVRAALAMLREQERWKAEREAKGLPAFEVGFGVNTGVAIAGAIGGEASRVNYSVLGDAVNVAARLESLCKEFSATILVSEATLAGCPADLPRVDLGETHVKGRSAPVRVFKLWPLDPVP